MQIFLKSRRFKVAIYKFFKIGMHVQTPELLKEFIEETESNEEYVQFINDWKDLDELRQEDELNQQGWVISEKSVDLGSTTF